VSLITVIFIIFLFLNTVKTTGVFLGPLIQDIASCKDTFSVIFFQSTSVIISPHLIPAFSDGDPEIGEIIFKTHGFSIST